MEFADRVPHSYNFKPYPIPNYEKDTHHFLGAAIGIGGSIALRHLLKKPPTIVNEKDDAAAKQKRGEEYRRQIAWRIAAPRIEIAQEEANKASGNSRATGA